MENLEW